MPINTLAEQQISERADELRIDAGAVEDRLPEFEPAARREALEQILGHELWARAGRPAGQHAIYVAQARQRPMYTKGDKEYTRDATANAKEALGFLKDWATSLIQLDLAVVGALGIFVGFSDFVRSPVFAIGHLHGLPQSIAIAEVVCIGLSAVAIFLSLFFGLMLLNALPGAAQRLPVNAAARQADVFSIANERHHLTINFMSWLFRYPFFAGALLFALSMGLGLYRSSFDP